MLVQPILHILMSLEARLTRMYKRVVRKYSIIVQVTKVIIHSGWQIFCATSHNLTILAGKYDNYSQHPL